MVGVVSTENNLTAALRVARCEGMTILPDFTFANLTDDFIQSYLKLTQDTLSNKGFCGKSRNIAALSYPILLYAIPSHPIPSHSIKLSFYLNFLSSPFSCSWFEKN